MPLKSVLIANRGEIACRIMRTARRLGMRTIAVYSEADASALHVRLADEAHCIGPAPAAASYLAGDRIVAAAKASGADCVHPGYGFLAENAEFAEACAAAGVIFIGPPPNAIRAMGLKDAAKALMEGAGVPVVPGYHGPRQEPAFLKRRAAEIGYPILIKAVAGGGGKGLRRIDAESAFEAGLDAAKREAMGAFGNARVLIEKYIASPRHIEFQIFADHEGSAIHLGERDCSLQRRHQKVVEEAPAPGMTAERRALMGEAAAAAALAVGYRGAGTVEFIAEGAGAMEPGAFYFMEMNTRLQVEHPVTEMITGLDLVEMQFRVAAGERLQLTQDELRLEGHAVEARLYAEDPDKSFLPSTGKLWRLRFPDKIRIDTGVEEGDAVLSFYDPMLAKIIGHGRDRKEALDRLAAALQGTLVAGPKTNLAFLAALIDTADFRAGRFDTGFIERNLARLTKTRTDEEAACIGFLRALLAREEGRRRGRRVRLDKEPSPWDAIDGYQLGPPRRLAAAALVEGERVELNLLWPQPGPSAADRDLVVSLGAAQLRLGDALTGLAGEQIVETPDAVLVLRGGRQTSVRLVDPLEGEDETDLAEGGTIRAPMHGKLVALLVKPGDRVAKGHRLALLEAMKMEHVLLAPIAGTIAEVLATEGAQIAQGAKILTIGAGAS